MMPPVASRRLLLRAVDIAREFGISVRTVSRWVELGLLPRPVTGPRRWRRWAADAVDNHCRHLAATK